MPGQQAAPDAIPGRAPGPAACGALSSAQARSASACRERLPKPHRGSLRAYRLVDGCQVVLILNDLTSRLRRDPSSLRPTQWCLVVQPIM
jgi:hypothetical protein